MKSQFSPNLKGVLILCAFVAVLVGVGVLIPRLINKPAVDGQTQGYDWQTPGQPGATAVVPAVTFPYLELPALAAQPPQLSFSEEEVAQLNEMLAAWAEEETFIRVGDDEEEGEDGSSSSSNNDEDAEYEADGGHDVAVWFLDVQSGAAYSYNEDFAFSYASLMKAPYAAWLYTLAQEGACDLEELIEIQPEDIGKYAENTGVLKTMELPDAFSVETLIGYMIRSSDTVALRVLLARYPAEGFKMWAQEQGVERVDALNSVVSGTLTAKDAGALMKAVYQVMEYGEHGALLRQHMENAGNRMITSDNPVARKYGWDEHAYHDMGVVYGEHPFIIVIMTDKWGGSYAEMAQFGTISRTLEGMMQAKWAAYQAENAG